MCKSYVAYYRVSTDKQGQSALGLEAQQSAVQKFIGSKGEDARLLASFTEIELGKKDDRPQLAAALAYAKCKKATLIIAKLDRLSRKAAFLLNLRDAGVDFHALDCPEMNTLTLCVMAGFAQHEREQISARTKAALEAVKPRVAVNGQKKHPEVKRTSAIPWEPLHLATREAWEPPEQQLTRLARPMLKRRSRPFVNCVQRACRSQRLPHGLACMCGWCIEP